ncbi:MAG: BlaI/MecI/CopY family transcriptional regulator [Pseudomonadota bacterium]
MPSNHAPAPAELAILNVLWDEETCSARQVHERIGEERGVGYTTILKQLQRMEAKGLVKRVPSTTRATLYRAVGNHDKVRQTLVSRLLDTAFGGSVGGLVAQALGQRPLSDAELDEIEKLIEQSRTKDKDQP